MTPEQQKQIDKAIWQSVGFKNETAFVQELCLLVRRFVKIVNKEPINAIDDMLQANKMAEYYLLICGSSHNSDAIVGILGKPGEPREPV